MITVLASTMSTLPSLFRVERLLSKSSSIPRSIDQLIAVVCVCFATVTMNVGVAEATQNRASTESKLAAIESKHFDTLLVADSFKIPVSRRIHIADAKVAFSSTWLLKFHNTAEYQKRIIKQYGQSLVKNLKSALIASGWKIVDSPGADTLRLDPRLFDVYISVPDEVGAKHSIVSSFGNTRIELVFKAPDNQPFMKIVDFGNMSNKSGAEANNASNYGAINKMMANWSKSAVFYLEQVMSIVEEKKGADL